MAHGDALEGKWRGNWRVEWVVSTLHTTSEHGVSSINTDAHTSAACSRLNWRPCRYKWTRPFRRKTKSGFCACAITFQTQSTTNTIRHLTITEGRTHRCYFLSIPDLLALIMHLIASECSYVMQSVTKSRQPITSSYLGRCQKCEIRRHLGISSRTLRNQRVCIWYWSTVRVRVMKSMVLDGGKKYVQNIGENTYGKRSLERWKSRLAI
jgi:hypothetical protein